MKFWLSWLALPTCVAVLATPGMAIAEVGVGVVAPAPALVSNLWRLPSSASGMRMGGEAGSRVWPIYVPAQIVPTLKRFQLGYSAAIAVMPEASWLTFTINGQTMGHVPIAAPTGVKTLSFDIPAGVLQPGWNAVGIDVSQHHRVDCSVASTYELWTQVDPARTGFVGGPPKIATLDDLPALATDDAGATRLHLVLPKDPSPAEVERAVKVAERVVLRGHFAHPVVDTASMPTGLTIMVATSGALAGQPSAKAPSGIQVSADPQGRPMLILSANNEGDLDGNINEFGGSAPTPTGTEDGLRALARLGGMKLKSGGTLSLDDLGIRSREFSGRLFQEAFDVVLPPDAYPADYDEARLSLDGGYAAGLTRDARLVVRVNGIIDGNLEFDRPGGAVLHGDIIHMPLEPFHPGHNRIEIEALLPALSDQTCDALKAIGAKQRFLLLGTTTLSLPRLARIAQFPSLSASFSGNLGITPLAAPRLFLPRTTDGAISAVATLLANATRNTGMPTNAVFLTGTPQSGSDPAIVVGNPSDLPAGLLAAAGLDAGAVSAAWRAGATPRPNGPGDAGLGRHGGSDRARLDAWGQGIDEDSGWTSGLGSSLRWAQASIVGSLRSAGLAAYPDRPITVTADTSFVYAQGLFEGAPLTLVTARDDHSLATGAAAMTDPSRVASFDGRAVLLDDGSQTADLTPARDTVFFRTEGFSIGNDRLVAAGWVSKHAGWYIGSVFLACMMLGASTSAFLVFGRKEG